VIDALDNEAMAVLQRCEQEAVDLKHGFIGTEHVLLSLTDAPEVAELLSEIGVDRPAILAELEALASGYSAPTDSEALASVGVDLAAVKSAVDARFGDGALALAPTRPHFTPRCRRALDVANRLANSFASRAVSPLHLLLALADPTTGGVAADVINRRSSGGSEELAARLERSIEAAEGGDDDRRPLDPERVNPNGSYLIRTLVQGGRGCEVAPEIRDLADELRGGAALLVDTRDGGTLLTRFVDVTRGLAAGTGTIMWPLGSGVYVLHSPAVRITRAVRDALLPVLSTPIP
jgi:hypothetical protein